MENKKEKYVYVVFWSPESEYTEIKHVFKKSKKLAKIVEEYEIYVSKEELKKMKNGEVLKSNYSCYYIEKHRLDF